MTTAVPKAFDEHSSNSTKGYLAFSLEASDIGYTQPISSSFETLFDRLQVDPNNSQRDKRQQQSRYHNEKVIYRD